MTSRRNHPLQPVNMVLGYATADAVVSGLFVHMVDSDTTVVHAYGKWTQSERAYGPGSGSNTLPKGSASLI